MGPQWPCLVRLWVFQALTLCGSETQKESRLFLETGKWKFYFLLKNCVTYGDHHWLVSIGFLVVMPCVFVGRYPHFGENIIFCAAAELFESQCAKFLLAIIWKGSSLSWYFSLKFSQYYYLNAYIKVCHSPLLIFICPNCFQFCIPPPM